jgi:hypothetical protein
VRVGPSLGRWIGEMNTQAYIGVMVRWRALAGSRSHGAGWPTVAGRLTFWDMTTTGSQSVTTCTLSSSAAESRLGVSKGQAGGNAALLDETRSSSDDSLHAKLSEIKLPTPHFSSTFALGEDASACSSTGQPLAIGCLVILFQLPLRQSQLAAMMGYSLAGILPQEVLLPIRCASATIESVSQQPAQI